MNVDEKRQSIVKEFYELQTVKIQFSFITHTDWPECFLKISKLFSGQPVYYSPYTSTSR